MLCDACGSSPRGNITSFHEQCPVCSIPRVSCRTAKLLSSKICRDIQCCTPLCHPCRTRLPCRAPEGQDSFTSSLLVQLTLHLRLVLSRSRGHVWRAVRRYRLPAPSKHPYFSKAFFEQTFSIPSLLTQLEQDRSENSKVHVCSITSLLSVHALSSSHSAEFNLSSATILSLPSPITSLEIGRPGVCSSRRVQATYLSLRPT